MGQTNRSTAARGAAAALLLAALGAAGLHAGPPPEDDPAVRYATVAERILQEVRRDCRAWERLEVLCDDIGPRLSGSENLARAIDWALGVLRADGQENVRAEPVTVPHWVRGNEWAEVRAPYRLRLAMLGLGGSVGTPPEGITAPVVCVTDFAQLEALPPEQVAGRIVLFNYPMVSRDPQRGDGYGSAVRYRVDGARRAAQAGAVACLIRSVTERSLRTPHTGALRYGDAPRRIPAAALSVEDAERIARLVRRGREVVVHLYMEARDAGTAESANVVAELTGRERPDEYVVIGGHLDSWDVGQGAHDDGGGCVAAIEALRILRRLGLRPRRTVRLVLWTNEENGLAGGREYVRRHEADMPAHVAAIELDAGVYAPLGLGVGHADPARQAHAVARLERIARLLEPLGCARVWSGGGGADIGPMRRFGVPTIGLVGDMTHYFDVHHTHADTLDKVDPHDLARHAAALAIVAYVLADMPARLDAPPGP